MDRAIRRVRAAITALTLSWLAVPIAAQPRPPDLAGMWSDPPATIEDSFCVFWCADAGLDRINALLDDPANDERPIIELYIEASRFQREQYLKPLLTAAALETLGRDPADDPGFRDCVPWAFAREIFAPHQFKVEPFADRIELQYGEWTIRRTVHLDRREPPANEPLTPMGYSVGRYEDGALVIETSRISANLGPWGHGFPVLEAFDGMHSDQLRAVERYTRSADGERLLLSVTLEDPWALREAAVLKKVWAWAPDQEISPYENCERPTEFSRGVTPP